MFERCILIALIGNVFGTTASTCLSCLNTGDSNYYSCLDGPTETVPSPLNYCFTSLIYDNNGGKPGTLHEIRRNAAFIINDKIANVNGTECKTDGTYFKCIQMCKGNNCNNSTTIPDDVKKAVNQNQCYDVSCVTDQINNNECILDDNDLISNTGKCETETLFDNNNNIISVSKRGKPIQNGVQTTYGSCIPYSASHPEITKCNQICIGDKCNFPLLSMTSCISCESSKGSIDFDNCLNSNSTSTDSMQLCPIDQPYCITRTSFNYTDNSILSVQKGCSNNETADFYEHQIPEETTCWNYTDDANSNVIWPNSCVKLCTPDNNQACNTEILNLTNFGKIPFTTVPTTTPSWNSTGNSTAFWNETTVVPVYTTTGSSFRLDYFGLLVLMMNMF